MQEVARRAGMSNGAIYGNFKNREDLLSAIGPTYWPQVRPQMSPGASFAEIMRAMAEALIEAMPARAKAGGGRLRGLAYTLGSGADGQRRGDLRRSLRRRGPLVARAVPRRAQLPMPAEALVRVLGALTEGLTFQRLLTPELIPDEVDLRRLRGAGVRLARRVTGASTFSGGQDSLKRGSVDIETPPPSVSE